MPAYEIYQWHTEEYNTAASCLTHRADWSEPASEQRWLTLKLKQGEGDHVTVCVCESLRVDVMPKEQRRDEAPWNTLQPTH